MAARDTSFSKEVPYFSGQEQHPSITMDIYYQLPIVVLCIAVLFSFSKTV